MLRELEVWSVGVRKELHLTWEVWSESVVTAQLATQPSLSNGRLTRSSFLPVPLRTLSWSHWICKLLSIGCPFSQYLFYQYMGGERSSLLLVSSLVSFFKVLNFSLKRSFTYLVRLLKCIFQAVVNGFFFSSMCLSHCVVQLPKDLGILCEARFIYAQLCSEPEVHTPCCLSTGLHPRILPVIPCYFLSMTCES